MTTDANLHLTQFLYVPKGEFKNIRKIEPLRTQLNAEVIIPGGKEDTNRALILGAISDGTVTLHNISHADDSCELIEGLRTIGVHISTTRSSCQVVGVSAKFKPFFSTIDSGISGTSSRFLAALCMLVPGGFDLICGKRMRERPMADLLNGLRDLGVQIKCLEVEDHLPFQYSNSLPALQGGKIAMSGTTSSQFFSALLLVAARLRNGLEIQVLGTQVSQSYIDMTERSLSIFGIKMQNEGYKKYYVPNTKIISAANYEVECDATAGTYFLSLAAITGGRVRVHGISSSSTQGDARFYEILKIMGCKASHDPREKWIEIEGPEILRACNVDMSDTPDSAQTLAVVAAFAKGTTRITGLSTLRIKETDRIAALEQELNRMGIVTDAGPDWIEIEGGSPHGALIKTYDDHRMAMSFAIAGAVVDDLYISGADTVNKSLPEFWGLLESIGIKVGLVSS